MSSFLCYFSLSCTTSTIASATLNDLFNALTGWIVASVHWLLSTVVGVLNATSDPTIVTTGASEEFQTLLAISPVLLVLGLLVATLQAVRHGDQAALWRTYLGVAPASVGGIFLARPLALMILQSIDALSLTASSHSAAHLATLGTALDGVGTIPSFGVFLLAVLLTIGGLLLWVELLLRTVALTFLLVLVPVVVPLSTFPALRRVGWRLAETFLVVAAAKFVVVVALSLGLGEVVGKTPTAVLTGVVTLLLACATPFLIFRLVPVMEQSAAHALDGLRHRAMRATMGMPSTPLGMAVSSLRPPFVPPGPPEPPEDLGFPTWQGNGDLPHPPLEGERPPAPTGTPRVRHGRMAIFKDRVGDVIGWHWDD